MREKILKRLAGTPKHGVFTAATRSEANAKAARLAGQCRTYGDMAALHGKRWIAEQIPDGYTLADELPDNSLIRNRAAAVLVQIWAGMQQEKITEEAIALAVQHIRKAMRETLVSIGCHEAGAKSMIANALIPFLPCEIRG